MLSLLTRWWYAWGRTEVAWPREAAVAVASGFTYIALSQYYGWDQSVTPAEGAIVAACGGAVVVYLGELAGRFCFAGWLTKREARRRRALEPAHTQNLPAGMNLGGFRHEAIQGVRERKLVEALRPLAYRRGRAHVSFSSPAQEGSAALLLGQLEKSGWQTGANNLPLESRTDSVTDHYGTEVRGYDRRLVKAFARALKEAESRDVTWAVDELPEEFPPAET